MGEGSSHPYRYTNHISASRAISSTHAKHFFEDELCPCVWSGQSFRENYSSQSNKLLLHRTHLIHLPAPCVYKQSNMCRVPLYWWVPIFNSHHCSSKRSLPSHGTVRVTQDKQAHPQFSRNIVPATRTRRLHTISPRVFPSASLISFPRLQESLRSPS